MGDRRLALPALALFAITSVAATPAAAFGGQGPYFGLKAAGIETEDAAADDVDIEFGTGFGISGLVGYQFDILRVEGEFGFQGIEGLSDTGVNSDLDVGRFTLNGYLDLPVAPGFGPYVGAGFGVATLSTEDDFVDEDSAFTWHVEGGLNFNVSDQFVISPFYRYQSIETDIGGQTEPLESNLFGVSLRYILTWRGRSQGDPYYSNNSYDRPGYAPVRTYDDRYERDRYYDDRRRYRKKAEAPKTAEQKERDRCGWKGLGCEDEEAEGWQIK